MQLAQCLKCGKPGVDNVDTRHDPHTGWIKRRKRCKACGHKWTSWEVPADALDAFRAVALGVQRAARELGDMQRSVEAIAALAQPAMATHQRHNGFGDSGHVVEPLIPYEASPIVGAAAQWLRGERSSPPPLPDSPEWPAHVQRICRTLTCDDLCDKGHKLCVRVATLGRLPTSEER